jgi:putative SOS response-associated peptidase YedK
MCGRFVTIIPIEELRAIFDLVESQTRTNPRYNVAPTQDVGVVRQGDDKLNHFDQLRWGLIPSWSKDASIAQHTINARSETVAEKPSFRHAIKKNRCIVPVSGFYEWSRLGGEKKPFYIHMADKSAMAMAGIWEYWKGPEGPIESFSILTTSANKVVGQLHDRMPVILRPEDYGMWLDASLQNPHDLEHLYVPFPDEEISLYEVSKVVNNARHDSPDCIEPV